jgi:hypothetical protein
MPDGSPYLSPRAVRIADAARSIMESNRAQGAALAWIAHVRPASGLPADDAGVALHFVLFARDSRYWHQLCRLFNAIGMGDGQGDGR